MKSSLVLLIYLLSLSLFYSCAEMEDPEVAPTIASEVYIPTNLIGGTWVPLSYAYVTELLDLQVPPIFEWSEDPELLQKYKHALLLQEYGNIRQVRTILEYELNRKSKITFASTDSVEYITYLDRTIAYLEALIFISPSEPTRLALESTKSEKLRLTLDMQKLIKEDPELFVQLERDRLMEQFGDIPEVHTYTNLLRKLLLQESLTDEEERAYLEARDHLWRNPK